MYYFIDSGDFNQIDEALSLGVHGVTANPSMYLKQQISLLEFVQHYANQGLSFLSGEVIGSYEEMMAQAHKLNAIDPSIIIKINFSSDGLRLVKELHKQGIKTAITLVFTMAQAIACINAGCEYIFFFIGRNEENGSNGLEIIKAIQAVIDQKRYECSVVAASIKNLFQLEKLASSMIDYVAIPYDLYKKSLQHPLTKSGLETFHQDFQKNEKNYLF